MTPTPATIAGKLTEAQANVLRAVHVKASPEKIAVDYVCIGDVRTGRNLERRGMLVCWIQESRPVREPKYCSYYFALTPLGLAVRQHLVGEAR